MIYNQTFKKIIYDKKDRKNNWDYLKEMIEDDPCIRCKGGVCNKAKNCKAYQDYKDKIERKKILDTKKK